MIEWAYMYELKELISPQRKPMGRKSSTGSKRSVQGVASICELQESQMRKGMVRGHPLQDS